MRFILGVALAAVAFVARVVAEPFCEDMDPVPSAADLAQTLAELSSPTFNVTAPLARLSCTEHAAAKACDHLHVPYRRVVNMMCPKSCGLCSHAQFCAAEPAMNVSVDAAPPVASEKHEHYDKACVGGNNLKHFTGKTVSECQALCNALESCMGFEHGVAHRGTAERAHAPGDCMLSGPSTNAFGCDGESWNADFYAKIKSQTSKLPPLSHPLFLFFPRAWRRGPCTTGVNTGM